MGPACIKSVINLYHSIIHDPVHKFVFIVYKKKIPDVIQNSHFKSVNLPQSWPYMQDSEKYYSTL